jgi:hypothetical protein
LDELDLRCWTKPVPQHQQDRRVVPRQVPYERPRLAKHRAGDPAKGPWPAPVVDRLEPVVAKYADDWDAWGHRKIWALAPP